MIININDLPTTRTMITDGVLIITGDLPVVKGPFGKAFDIVSDGDLNVHFPAGEYNPFLFFRISARGKVRLLNKAPGSVHIDAPKMEFSAADYPDLYAQDARSNSLISWDHDLPRHYPTRLNLEEKFDLLMEHLGLQILEPNDAHTSEGKTTVASRWRIVKR